VKKIYNMDGVETPAIRGIDLKIKKQEFIAIMGSAKPIPAIRMDKLR